MYTAIALASLSKPLGISLITIVPETTPLDTIALLKSLGVDIVRPPEGIRDFGSIAARIHEQTTGSVLITDVIYFTD